jgi:hypothetical protein
MLGSPVLDDRRGQLTKLTGQMTEPWAIRVATFVSAASRTDLGSCANVACTSRSRRPLASRRAILSSVTDVLAAPQRAAGDRVRPSRGCFMTSRHEPTQYLSAEQMQLLKFAVHRPIPCWANKRPP